MGQVEDIIGNIRKGLLFWYNLKKECTVLFVGAKEDPLTEYLKSLFEEGKIREIYCIEKYEDIRSDWQHINLRTE